MNDIEIIKNVFAEKLKDLMQEKNINSTELAKLINIPRTSISNWLNKRRLVQVDAVKKIAVYFGVTTDYLLGLED